MARFIYGLYSNYGSGEYGYGAEAGNNGCSFHRSGITDSGNIGYGSLFWERTSGKHTGKRGASERGTADLGPFGRIRYKNTFAAEEGKTYKLEVWIDFDNDGALEYYWATTTVPYIHTLEALSLRSILPSGNDVPFFPYGWFL